MWTLETNSNNLTNDISNIPSKIITTSDANEVVNDENNPPFSSKCNNMTSINIDSSNSYDVKANIKSSSMNNQFKNEQVKISNEENRILLSLHQQNVTKNNWILPFQPEAKLPLSLVNSNTAVSSTIVNSTTSQQCCCRCCCCRCNLNSKGWKLAPCSFRYCCFCCI